MTDSPSSLIETVARAMFEGQPRKPSWDALKSWATGRREDQVPGTVGFRAAKVRGDEPFSEAREEMDEWLGHARAALLAIEAHASEKSGFALLGDGWVICRNKEPDPITDTERAEIDRRLFQNAVRVVEATGTHVVMPVEPTEAMLDAPNWRADAGHGVYAALLSSRPRVT